MKNRGLFLLVLMSLLFSAAPVMGAGYTAAAAYHSETGRCPTELDPSGPGRRAGSWKSGGFERRNAGSIRAHRAIGRKLPIFKPLRGYRRAIFG